MRKHQSQQTTDKGMEKWFWEGWNACEDGLSVCPYPLGTKAFGHWMNGWYCAEVFITVAYANEKLSGEALKGKLH